jgi:hypothetical protein
MAGHFVRWTGDPGFPASEMHIPQAIRDSSLLINAVDASLPRVSCWHS